jgi:hypothetical protein
MRAKDELNGVSVKAYAGSTGVLLGMNVTSQRRAGLLGFAIERHAKSTDKTEFLHNRLNFAGVAPTDPQAAQDAARYGTPSNRAPIQKFRWSDYRVYPDNTYTYTIHPVYGAPGQLRVEDGPSVTVRTASTQDGEHRVLFNRAAAASQAFTIKFADFSKAVSEELSAARKEKRKANIVLPDDVREWLGRDVPKQITGFIERAADKTWALDVAIYEYELAEIIQAVEAAHARGVSVRVVYHAKPRDEQTTVNEENLRNLPAEVKRARETSKICHHKFIVLSRIEGGERVPQAVLCGSTNFTENGVYRQANVVHIAERPDLAAQYLALHNVLFQGKDPRATRKYIDESNLFGDAVPLFAGFSPRSKLLDIQRFVEEVRKATRDVLFCTAFDLNDDLEMALMGQPNDDILRYGLQNTRSKITGFKADQTRDFVATAMLTSGLEGFLKESTAGQRGNILVHTKIIVVDFTSDSPVVISGSHNFSNSASEGNDENFLMLRGDPDLADCYGCEVLRLYDHYSFRFHNKEKVRTDNSPLTLSGDDSWTDSYFDMQGDHLKVLDRLRFAGEAV